MCKNIASVRRVQDLYKRPKMKIHIYFCLKLSLVGIGLKPHSDSNSQAQTHTKDKHGAENAEELALDKTKEEKLTNHNTRMLTPPSSCTAHPSFLPQFQKVLQR